MMAWASPNASTGSGVCSKYKLREDKISHSPDEVLDSILSRLTLEEATRTSILSTRWRYLWTRVTHLDFVLSRKELVDIQKGRDLSRKQKLCHVNRVNRVLEAHDCHVLEKFRIALPLDREDYHCEIDKWIKFVLPRKVQAFEIDLREPSGSRSKTWLQYTLPLHWTSSLWFSASFFSALKSLSLKFVGVNDQMAKRFLSSCPMLQHLSIQGCSQLQNLQVVGPSIKLKYLEIRDIILKISIKLCNVEYLESFTSLNTRYDELVLENLPSLVQINVDPLMMCRTTADSVARMSQGLDQLVELNLKMTQPGVFTAFARYVSSLFKFPKMEKLRVLKLEVLSAPNCPLLAISALFDVSPYLHRFAIQIERAEYEIEELNDRPMQALNHCPANEHLKVVKFGGYSGHVSELEFSIHLFRYAVALETFVVDTRTFTDPNRRRAKHARVIKGRAQRQFEKITPQEVKLIIL